MAEEETEQIVGADYEVGRDASFLLGIGLSNVPDGCLGSLHSVSTSIMACTG
ncbi:hypothetical protein Patl1_08749 [Pistacia atlantica]|uniref:Uncharacterized protein n=1 Tax=Pistacia atlantica TaxID=434234 RepID=A0ACC1ACS1_9ROSI|nr:hypothetical protein Patl1_08749 [Pistacia atlantica]